MVHKVIDRSSFAHHMVNLKESIVNAIVRHFEGEHLSFDKMEFFDVAASDIDAVVRSAIFEGARIFPVPAAPASSDSEVRG